MIVFLKVVVVGLGWWWLLLCLVMVSVFGLVAPAVAVLFWVGVRILINLLVCIHCFIDVR